MRTLIFLALAVLLLAWPHKTHATTSLDPCYSFNASTCAAGYVPSIVNTTLCQCAPGCASVGCLNGGTCNTTTGICTCTGNYQGNLCALNNECEYVASTGVYNCSQPDGTTPACLISGTYPAFVTSCNCTNGLVGPTCSTAPPTLASQFAIYVQPFTPTGDVTSGMSIFGVVGGILFILSAGKLYVNNKVHGKYW